MFSPPAQLGHQVHKPQNMAHRASMGTQMPLREFQMEVTACGCSLMSGYMGGRCLLPTLQFAVMHAIMPSRAPAMFEHHTSQQQPAHSSVGQSNRLCRHPPGASTPSALHFAPALWSGVTDSSPDCGGQRCRCPREQCLEDALNSAVAVLGRPAATLPASTSCKRSRSVNHAKQQVRMQEGRGLHGPCNLHRNNQSCAQGLES